MRRIDEDVDSSEISQWQWNVDRSETQIRQTGPVSRLVNRLWLRLHTSWLGERFSVGVITAVGIALIFRLAAIPFSLLRINPYAQSDVHGFARRAARIGHGFLHGQVLVGPLYRGGNTVITAFLLGGGGATFDVSRYWGLIMSPFWIFPGPSLIYAHIGTALLGVFAVYNVYAIGRYYRSSAVGVLAALPVAVFPSIVFVQATLLREGAVLAGISTAAHLLICPPRRLPRWVSAVFAVVVLVVIAPLRPENIPLYLLAIAVGVTVAVLNRLSISLIPTMGLGVIVAVLVGIVGRDLLQRAIGRLGRLHQYRAVGRTAYLTSVDFNTVAEAVRFAPIGALYFLYSPFPWMVQTPADVLIVLQAIGSVVFTIAAFWGVVYALRRSPARTAALLVGFLAASTLYGIVEANVGASVRHRQMFIWVIYLFGGLGAAEWYESTFVGRLFDRI